MKFAANWFHESATLRPRRTESESAVQSLPKPALKHARTKVQSNSESRPIRRTSRCSNVTENNLKKDGW
jgi:hypothetical protein